MSGDARSTSWWWRTASAVASRARTKRLLAWLERAQTTRVRIEEVQGAALHFLALPSRQDVRRIERRLKTMRERVAQMEREVAERGARAAARTTAASPRPADPSAPEADEGSPS